VDSDNCLTKKLMNLSSCQRGHLMMIETVMVELDYYIVMSLQGD
jgi:hypothetical protein